MSKWIRYSLIALLIVLLVLVRRYESVLFYDPFLKYFHGHLGKTFYPEYDLIKVIISVCFRYIINAAISLGIIWLIYNNKGFVKFSLLVLLTFFVALLPLYIYLVQHYFELGNNFGFYVRRFLIQPVLLLILVPALSTYQSQNIANKDADV